MPDIGGKKNKISVQHDGENRILNKNTEQNRPFCVFLRHRSRQTKNDMVKRKIKKEDFEHIIDEYQDRMFSFAFFRTGSYESAQDLVQDLFVRLYENREQYEVDNLKAYLFKSLLNACMDYKRKESRTPRVPLDSLQDVPDVEETKCVQEYVRIETMLRDLPDEQAEVVKMKFVDDFSFVEIADLLNLSVNTVKSRYRYAVDNLRKEYKIECV